MNLVKYATRVVVRRVVGVLVLLVLAWAGIGQARAGTLEQEYKKCAAFDPGPTYLEWRLASGCEQIVWSPTTGKWQLFWFGGPSHTSGPYRADFIYSGLCPTGTEWDDYSKTCFSGEQCLARNSELGSAKDQPRPSATISRCVAGCQFAMQGTPERTTIGPAVIYRGVMEYTGYSCSASPTDPEAPLEEQKTIPNQECVPTGDGAGQACVKPSGEQCMSSARTGKQFCWKPGETGQKTDADMMQKRDPGETPIPPNLSLPNGDTLSQKGQPITSTTTTNTTTTTTTTTNYTTNFGTNAGDSHQGESSGGDKGDEGGVTGGGDCDTPPSATGDQVLAAVVRQTWATRCAIEGKVGGTGACDAPAPTCVGSKILCQEAERSRQRWCDSEASKQAFRDQLAVDANADDGHGDVDPSKIWASGEGGSGTGIRTDLFGGGTSGSCDFNFTIGGQPVILPPEFWTLAGWIQWLFVALAYIWVAGRILD